MVSGVGPLRCPVAARSSDPLGEDLNPREEDQSAIRQAMPDAEVPASGHPSDMGGQPSHPEEDASSEGSSDGATGRDVLVGLAEQVRA